MCCSHFSQSVQFSGKGTLTHLFQGSCLMFGSHHNLFGSINTCLHLSVSHTNIAREFVLAVNIAHICRLINTSK